MGVLSRGMGVGGSPLNISFLHHILFDGGGGENSEVKNKILPYALFLYFQWARKLYFENI